MRILPLAYDSFSTRSMATIVTTDIKLFIDPSVAIAPKRYNLPPHYIELQELDLAKQRIINEAKDTKYIIITHYHWDHCPNPEEKHFKILHNKIIFLKNSYKDINRSQKERANFVIKNIKHSKIIFADNKEFILGNTYIKFSPAVWHGPYNSVTGYVIMIYIEYKNYSLIFASDVQGILTEESKKWIIENNPKILILSGPAIYLPFWDKKLTQISIKNLKEIFNKTEVKEVIIDHHLTRSLQYKNFIDELSKNNEFIKIQTAAEYLGIKNKLLEARRKELFEKENIKLQK